METNKKQGTKVKHKTVKITLKQPVMRCDGCVYWQLKYEYRYPDGYLREFCHKDDFLGCCRRYPPQLDTVYAGKMEKEKGEGCEALVTCWQQPITNAASWCGEFKVV
jgi:hypothetical protein